MARAATATVDAPEGGEVLQLSAFQRRVLSIPEQLDVFLGGGRGGAKSYTLALLALRHAEQYRERARIVYLRQSHKGTADFGALCLDLFGRIYERALRFNGQEGLFRFPGGATLEVNQLADATDYAKYQGRSFTLLLIDEAGQWPTPDLLDKLRSNLRGPKDLPLRMVLAANPGDVGHQWCAARYVFKAAPWLPFDEAKSGRQFVYAPSTFLDNPFVDQAAYRKQLEASCPSDPDLLRAWCQGDWTIARGSYFGAVLSEDRNAIDPWPKLPPPKRWFTDEWTYYLAHDFGSTAPSVTYLVARSPGMEAFGKFYPRDSLILFDELATNEPGSLTKGMGYTVPVLAEMIVAMCKKWGVRPEGVADDSIFARSGSGAGSIAEEFRRAGVAFRPAKKADRITGWNIMRRLLQDAGKVDVPGMYVARSCEYFWQTVPYLPRDPKRVEDVRSVGVADHAADCARYSCLRQDMRMQKMHLSGV